MKQSLVILSLFFAVFFISCKKDKNSSPAKAVNLYFTGYTDNTVNKIDLVNTPNAVTSLFNSTKGITTPEGITLTSDGYLIVAQETKNNIVKMHANGTGDVAVLYDATDGVNDPTAITIDNSTGTIYWCNSGSKQVMKGSDNGLTTPTILFGGQNVINYAYGIAIDAKNNKLYTSDFGQYIKVGKLDGSGTMDALWNKTKFTSMVSPSNIFIDPDHNKIYWSDESASQVVEAALDGTGTPVVLFDNSDGVARADGVFIDYNSKKIYWSETTSHVIARGNLDGTGTREVLVSNVVPYVLVLELK